MNASDFQKRLDEMTVKAKEVFNLPSVSISVTTGGKDYHSAAGMADLEKEVPASADTIYAIGSTTKAFTATLLCMLAEKGELDFNAPVRTYLPDFEMYDPYMTEHLTVRDTLCHRCGLPRYDLSMFNRPDLTKTEDWVRLLRYMQPVFEPRTQFSYQNHMFMLATVIAEKLHGQKWTELVRDKIFAPLGMTGSYGDGSLVPDGPDKARPYIEIGGEITRMPYNYHSEVSGAGTIYASTADMLKWLRFHLNGDERLVSQALLDEMHTPQMIVRSGDRPFGHAEIDSYAYCMGWTSEYYKGIKLHQHSGAIDGFRASAIMSPGGDFAAAILANHNSTNATAALSYMAVDAAFGLEPIDWCRRYADITLQIEEQQAKITEESRAKAEAAGEQYGNLTGIEGTYTDAVFGDLTITIENGKPILKGFNESFPLQGGAGDLFVIFYEAVGMSFEVQLKRNHQSKVTALTIPLEPMRKDPILFGRRS